MEKCYGGADSEKRFKKPNIQMWVECVGHVNKPEHTILRLHFFDRACTSYGSYASMWGSANATNLGVIGKSNSANKSYLKAKENPPKKKDSKWESLVEARQSRSTEYQPLADAQLAVGESGAAVSSLQVMAISRDLFPYNLIIN